jgi:hypothetical protein
MKELFEKMYKNEVEEVGCKTCKNKQVNINELRYRRPGEPMTAEEMNRMAEIRQPNSDEKSCKTCNSKSMFDKKYTGLIVGGFYVVFATVYGTFKLIESFIMLFTR